MKKLITSLLIALVVIFSKVDTISAEVNVADVSAELKTNKPEEDFDFRVLKLKVYLSGHNSPLAAYSDVFVKYADEYDLDWRLVAAISGVESTFGKRIPYKSYNAYGWANGKYAFESWEDSIEVVSKTLREKYIDDGLTTIGQIARRYAPPSSTWARNVKFFINKIDPLGLDFTLEG